jgi:hypothetical protein
MLEALEITLIDLTDIFFDSVRFGAHIFFMHMLSYSFDDETSLLGIKLLKTLIFTVISITIYHLLVKKIIYRKKQK